MSSITTDKFVEEILIGNSLGMIDVISRKLQLPTKVIIATIKLKEFIFYKNVSQIFYS